MTREELPEGQIYIIKTVQLQYALPSEMANLLNSYAKSPNAVQFIDSTMTLVLRDYSSNVKRMLELIELVDVELPDLLQVKYKVLPVKYEDAYNIANLLASLSNPAQGSNHQIQRTGTSGRGTTSRGTTAGRARLRPWSRRRLRTSFRPEESTRRPRNLPPPRLRLLA